MVIVEVLSDSTEIYDRGDKAFRYRQCPSLREYIMVSQRERRVEVQHREPNGTWIIETIEGEGQFAVKSLGFSLNLDDIYRNDLPG
jgi:Uma2 family endonuclease